MTNPEAESYDRNILKKIADFHGHYCPGIAYGLRVSQIGMAKTKTSDNQDLLIIAQSSSCLVDALQIVTGCTTGNGKLRIVDDDSHTYLFWDKRLQKGVRLALKRLPETSRNSSASITIEKPRDESRFELDEIDDPSLKGRIQKVLMARVDELVECKEIDVLPDFKIR